MKTTAIVLAGGSGSRFGSNQPKQLVDIAGHPILHHALRRFDRSDRIDELIIAANPDWFGAVEAVCARAIYDTPWKVVAGGPERNLSVWAAVQELQSSSRHILIHDAVRPLVSSALIERVLDALNDSRAVLPVIPSVDPVVRVSQGGSVEAFAPRSQYLRGQSPQGFYLGDLVAAMEDMSASEIGAHATVYELLLSRLPGYTVQTVEGDLNNIKVTMPVDHMLVGQLLLDGV